MPPTHPYLGLVIFLVVCFAAAGIGGAVTTPKIATWYSTLAKPSWNPPNWIFGPVWSALYFCMARPARSLRSNAIHSIWRQYGISLRRANLLIYASKLSREPLIAWLLPDEPEICDNELAIPGVPVVPVAVVLLVLVVGFEALLDRACSKPLRPLLFPAPPP